MNDLSMLVKILYHDSMDEVKREEEKTHSDLYLPDDGYDVSAVVDRNSIPMVIRDDPIGVDSYINGEGVRSDLQEEVDSIKPMLKGNLYRVFKDSGMLTYKKNADGYFIQNPESVERGEELSLDDESTYIHANTLPFAATKTYGKYPGKNLRANRH